MYIRYWLIELSMYIYANYMSIYSIYALVQAEVDAISPDPTLPLHPSHIPHLQYTTNTIKESMRLWPIYAFNTIRICEDRVEYMDMVIPSGAAVLLFPLAILRGQGISVRYVCV